MFKSIFWKQFILYIGILVISFVLLAIATSQAFKGYFISRRELLLQEQASRIVEILLEPYSGSSSRFSTLTLQVRMEDQIKSIQSYMDASVLFIDAEYKVYMATTDMRQCIGVTLSSESLAAVMDGKVVSIQGQLSELIPTKLLTVAYPIILNNQVLGAVLLNVSIPELEQTVADVVRITVISIVVAGAVAFVLIYFSSRTITKPLREMNAAAKVIAGGDFEKRIKVKSRDEVGQLGESFNDMAESLAQQERSRREFISNISHDLRTPLTSMRGFLEAVLDGTAPAEETDRYLNIVLEETERLSKLADGLNRLQSAEAELLTTEFDINELVRKTAAIFETRVADGEITLSMELAGGRVRADYEKITRVVYNLLDNAVKFTPPGGTIAITTLTEGKKVRVAISDSGCGIDAALQKRIFERFYKADESRSKSGSGLGLAIVQAFIKAHGESLTVTSAAGEGSEFVFTLAEADA